MNYDDDGDGCVRMTLLDVALIIIVTASAGGILGLDGAQYVFGAGLGFLLMAVAELALAAARQWWHP